MWQSPNVIPKNIKSEIIRYCHRMDRKNWVANHDGNITVRIGNNSLAATPTARPKIDLKEEDLIEVDMQGKKTSGTGNPFSEIAVHLRILRNRPEVNAIVHAHPIAATAVGCANQEMVTWAVPEAVVSIGPGIPLIGLTLPNSEIFFAELDAITPYYDVVMIGGNGVFTWGKTLEQAFLRLELAEHLAQILLTCSPLAAPKLLEPAEVAKLLKKRADAGLALPIDPARPHWFPNTH
ncbi:MAG: hypothetical protein A3K03_06580 [Bdellovibrionales bacterium RIFOXYD1_FULL_44_7]|nr:MAG: hypothetical protein A3K03_06580 [Bdellovibrionales bacterium RIFOXYD1_FULL_44_7]